MEIIKDGLYGDYKIVKFQKTFENFCTKIILHSKSIKNQS